MSMSYAAKHNLTDKFPFRATLKISDPGRQDVLVTGRMGARFQIEVIDPLQLPYFPTPLEPGTKLMVRAADIIPPASFKGANDV